MSGPTNTAIDWQAWQEAITKWARDATGNLRVMWARQAVNAPQPAKPYVLLDIISSKRRGSDGLAYVLDVPTGMLVATSYGTRQIVLNVQVVAEANGLLAQSAMAWAEEMQNELESGASLQAFVNVGLAVCDFGQARDLAAFEQSQFVSRATFDVVLEGAAVKGGTRSNPAVVQIIGNGDVEGNSTPELTFDVED